MKLVNILVRELPEWPENSGVFTQDKDKTIWFYQFDFLDIHWDGLAESEKKLKLNELATDYTSAIITKEMWESARE